MNKGQLYLIPVPIADGAVQTLSPAIGNTTATLKHFFVENVRTARRFLRLLHATLVIDELSFYEIDKHTGPDINMLKKLLKDGKDVGVMSEAGCPGIADPGSVLVKAAHDVDSKVIPLTGPNSIVLALMASGMNGQSFCFNGYLPVKEPARSQKIKQLEHISAKESQTQIFIETPFRNNAMVEELLKHCRQNTLLCIAQNLTAENEFIKTLPLSEWKKNKPDMPKEPAVFLILAQ